MSPLGRQLPPQLEEGREEIAEVAVEIPEDAVTSREERSGGFLGTASNMVRSCLSLTRSRLSHASDELENENVSKHPSIMVSFYFLILSFLFLGAFLFSKLAGEKTTASFFLSCALLILALAITGYSYEPVRRLLRGQPLENKRSSTSKNC
ncbi:MULTISPECIES: hypothetical protein [Candidatus Ichthyocystis]|uniref:Putative membrane protein n=1 Tax=Candidatus Ichthyocystis hellenicum TaxID=1561003 RepID=A0A0S4M479_9BURK|nr:MULTISPECIES: hypothetical protein [Ichthyocystis]CUT17110.1 putative membrane protein [Candidatus Ichthyocystis hellenicum]